MLSFSWKFNTLGGNQGQNDRGGRGNWQGGGNFRRR